MASQHVNLLHINLIKISTFASRKVSWSRMPCLLPDPLDLHAYFWNTSGVKRVVKIQRVPKTHSRSPSCLANPMVVPFVSSDNALVSSWQAPRRSCEAFTGSWEAQPGVGPFWGRARQESGEPVVSSASANKHHTKPECPGTCAQNVFSTHEISRFQVSTERARRKLPSLEAIGNRLIH